MVPTAPLPSEPSRFETLLRQAQGGSAEARWMLIQLYRKWMLAITNSKLDSDIRSKEGASDIVSKTIIEAQGDFEKFHGRSEPELKAWLHQVLSNNYKNHLRYWRSQGRNAARERPLAGTDSHPFGPGDLPGDDPTPSTPIQRGETIAALKRVLDELKPHYRQIIILRSIEGLSYEAIARRMGRTELSARKLFSRAKDDLAQRMQPYL